MILNFYYETQTVGTDPLVASARIPGQGNLAFPWSEGDIEFFETDLGNLPGGLERWAARDRDFRGSLRAELKKHIVVRNRESLKPWTRLAFENIHRYGITNYPWVFAKLFEDDGSEFDVARATPLYSINSGQAREPFNPPELDPEEAAAMEDELTELSKMHLERKRALNQGNAERTAEIEAVISLFKQARKQGDNAKLDDARARFQQQLSDPLSSSQPPHP